LALIDLKLSHNALLSIFDLRGVGVDGWLSMKRGEVTARDTIHVDEAVTMDVLYMLVETLVRASPPISELFAVEVSESRARELSGGSEEPS
jgi:hypothetical protein